MTCLPERYIYGWIFRGAIIGRKKLLQEKAKAKIEIIKVMNKLIPEDAFRLDQANRKLKRIAYRLRSMDAEVIMEERYLFDTGFHRYRLNNEPNFGKIFGKKADENTVWRQLSAALSG